MRRRFYLGFFMVGLAVTGTAMTGGDVGETLTTGFKRAAADLPFADRLVPGLSAGLAAGSGPSETPAATPKPPGPDPLASLVATAREMLAGDQEGPSPGALPDPPAGEEGTMRQIAPPEGSDRAAMEAALRALARSFAPPDAARPAVSVPRPEADPAAEGPRAAPVVLRPGGGSSAGLPQVGR
ncbi:hypothetical protein DLJ49_17255 [Rhodovulum sp. 12E13]|uniref:hypothetical protein n=1 Tax=Rhodovulum sp. 12E13 TaxID=2203891 RepID=UPI000E160CDF|nr:hypothetical protein [Rhodovulum sp. 12E13]RDC70935.1 hypothetical protein DLJ49_17255 [Rhodovulum sp. 12E13]